MIKPVAMGPHEAKDPFRELDLGVQIVSRPPDHFRIQNWRFPMWFGVSFTPPYHNFLQSNETGAV
jgi:hypothetical protein